LPQTLRAYLSAAVLAGKSKTRPPAVDEASISIYVHVIAMTAQIAARTVGVEVHPH